MLTRSLQSVKVPISYLHDSDIIENDKIKTIALDNIDIQFIDSTTTVTLTNRLILPLIFYYYFDRKYDITLGQNNFDQKYSDFFKSSFITESQRSGKYTLVNSNTSDYTLDISIDTIDTKSNYRIIQSHMYFGVISMSIWDEKRSPSVSQLVLSVRLKNKNDIVFKRNYVFGKTQELSIPKSNNSKTLRTDFMTNMVESLSLNTKGCIEIIIDDINREIN